MFGATAPPPSAKQRARHYREQAKHFRRLSEAEPIEGIRQQLAALAEQYQQLADLLLQSN
jgi:hypothetical protein